MLLLAGAMALAAPPATLGSFCATLHQFASLNGSSTADSKIPLCLDFPRWSQRAPPPGGARAGEERFNGTHRFDLTPNVTAPGGVNCVVTAFGKPDPRSPPFGFVAVDADATFNRTAPMDGFPGAQVWSAARPFSPHTTKYAWMNWFIAANSSSSSSSSRGGGLARLLRSTCTQLNTFVPGLSVGSRDFAQDFVAPPPPGAFEPPAAAVCTPAPAPGPPPAPFVPGDGCHPACAAGSLCCRDPSVAADTGCCYAVSSCSQVHGGAGARGVAFTTKGTEWW